MSLQDLVNVSISSSTVSPTRPGFGTPMFAAYHTHYTDYIRFYSSLAAMVSDGFSTTEPAYLGASAMFAQNPAPAKVAIGRRDHYTTQVLNLTLTDTTGIPTYKFTLVFAGVSYPVSVQSTGVLATDVATINTAVTALSVPHLTATNDSTSKLILTMAEPYLLDIQGWNPSGSPSPLLTLSDSTSQNNIATDLTSIAAAAQPGSYYGVAIESNSKSEVTAAAGWAESAGAFLFLYNNSDTVCITSETTLNIFSTQKTLAHARSGGLYAGSQVLCYSGAAWLGKTLPQTPGSLTFMYKTLSGVPGDTLTETAQTNLNGKNANYYTPIAGINITVNGWDAAGEFLDIVWGTDALTAQIQIDVFSLLANALKVPYTDLGADMIKSIVQSDLTLFASPQYNFIANSPAPTVSAPTVASIASATRASRVFPSIAFSGKLAGAIHSLTISGVLSP